MLNYSIVGGKMNTYLLKKYEKIGAVFTFLAASLLHFVYEWSDGALWSVLFGAVNESVWEHVKIITMPYFVWAVIEFCICKPAFRRFFVSKIVGLYFLGGIIIGFFYLYTSIIGRSIPLVDIGGTFIWICLAFWVSYRLYMSKGLIQMWFSPALFMLVLYMAMYFGFTVCPPKCELFKDPLTGQYGIIPSYLDTGAFYMDILNT